MTRMMAKGASLGGLGHNWMPHLMFHAPVTHWSDGSPAPVMH